MSEGTKQPVPRQVGRDTLTRHRFLPTRAGVIELIVLFAVLVAIERLFMQPGDFAKLHPHPYWLPVILLSLQYGTADGVLAAAAAILVGLTVGWPSQGPEEDYYRYVVRTWSEPIAWIIASILIGEIRSRQRSQIAELTRNLATTRTQANDITAHCYKLEDKIGRLEREFATIEVQSLDSIAAAFQALRTGDAQAWQDAFARAYRGVIGAGTTTLLLRSDRQMVAVARAEIAPQSAGLSPADNAARGRLVEGLMRERRPLCLLRQGDVDYLGQEAILAIPLLGEGDGRLIGALLVEMLEPGRLTSDMECRFELLGREIAQALAARGASDLIESAGEAARFDLPASVRTPEPADTDPGGRIVGRLARFGRG